jgi:hypothetical protein
MDLIINTVKSTSPLTPTCTRKWESKDLHHPRPSKQLCSSSRLTNFTGQVCPNSTTTYSPSIGCLKRNAADTLLAIWYHHSWLCTWDLHLLHLHTILLRFLPLAALQLPSSRAQTNYSSSLIQLAPMRLKNGDLSRSLSRNLCHCIHHVYKMVSREGVAPRDWVCP